MSTIRRHRLSLCRGPFRAISGHLGPFGAIGGIPTRKKGRRHADGGRILIAALKPGNGGNRKGRIERRHWPIGFLGEASDDKRDSPLRGKSPLVPSSDSADSFRFDPTEFAIEAAQMLAGWRLDFIKANAESRTERPQREDKCGRMKKG